MKEYRGAHTPDGFGWGYGGSGPAQLALALAADLLGDDDRAGEVYQRLKTRVVASLPEDDWILGEHTLRAAVEAVERDRARSRE